ncbi:hypothetical protein IIA95_00460 [Patescibacteria group bacterium]|nr:hypothetical protein [Patescibacteria group bacterium]
MKLFKLFSFSLSLVLLFAGTLIAAEHLPAPTINISPDVYYPLDEILYIEGVSRPNSAVQIQLTKQGARPVRFTVRSDVNGEWVLAEKVPLTAGDWEVRARLLHAKDSASSWSNPRVFKAIVSGITVGGINIKFAFLSFLVVVLLALGIAAFWYFSWKVKRLNARLLTKEIREAKDSVREGLSELRRDLLDELRILELSGKKLSADERARKEHVLRELDTLGRNMEKEIQDIEEKL